MDWITPENIVTAICTFLLSIGIVVWKRYNQEQLEDFMTKLVQSRAFLTKLGTDLASKENLVELTNMVKETEAKYNNSLELLRLNLLKQSSMYQEKKNVLVDFLAATANYLAHNIDTINRIDSTSEDLANLREKCYKIQSFIIDEEIIEKSKQIFNEFSKSSEEFENIDKNFKNEKINKQEAKEAWHAERERLDKAYTPLNKEFVMLIDAYLQK